MSANNNFIPFFGTLANKLEPLALPLLRTTAGLIFIFHGFGKFERAFFGEGLDGLAAYISSGDIALPVPLFFAWLAMIVEFFGGIGLVLGLFTRLWAFLGCGMMLLISFFVKGAYVDGALNISARAGGIEYDLTIAVILGLIFIWGAGKYSLDSKMKKTF